jgi:(+)-trans-carveol dehydrogenase
MQDKVAFITGAARGQGRALAVRMADEGADVIVMDVCEDLPTAVSTGPTKQDLEDTVGLVEERGRRAVARVGDVRDSQFLSALVSEGVAELGRLDVVCANAGIASFGPALELSDAEWTTMIDINLTGVWRTVKAAAPAVVAGGRGGSIVLTSSVAGLIGFPNTGHYAAAKHGMVGLMKVLAMELAPERIRVNAIHPTNVDTPMIQNQPMYRFFGGRNDATREDAAATLLGMHALPLPWVEVEDVANAVVWLSSDEARYITGVSLPIEAGLTHPFKLPHKVEAS